MIVLEPWAEVFELLPKQSFEFIAQSKLKGEFEFDFDGEYEGLEWITIYAWSGCNVEVVFEGANICKSGSITAFEVPSSFNSISDFTKKMFGTIEE